MLHHMHLSFSRDAIGFAALAIFLTPSDYCHAQEAVVSGKIIAVEVASQRLELEAGGKLLNFRTAPNISVNRNGQTASLVDLRTGSQAKVIYEKSTRVASALAVTENVNWAWRFFDVFNKGVKPDQAFIVGQDGRLVCLGKAKGYCLATEKLNSTYQFKIEFLLPKSSKSGAFIGIASSLPNPAAKDWMQQFPFGIEIKLDGDAVGELILPKENFKAELPLGQLRDGRKIVAIRKPELKLGDWNMLEANCDEHRNVVFKINGTTVNAIANAESTEGHIVIFPHQADLQFRSPVIVRAGEDTQIPFSSIASQ